MAASHVKPPPNNAAGPALATLLKTDIEEGEEKHSYIVLAGKVTKTVDYTLTRPNNTTTYTDGDAVTDTGGAGHTYAQSARCNADSGHIVAAVCSSSANETLKPAIELWLFGGTAVPTADADNAAFTPSDAEILHILGVISFPAASWLSGTAGTGGSSVCPGTILPGAGARIPFTCGAGVDDIYGLTVIRNAYVPIASEVFKFRLTIEQD